MHLPTEVDDPHRVVPPGGTTSYELVVPEGAAGTYWYHPHVHGDVAWQRGAGLVGAMVVTGPDDGGALARDARHAAAERGHPRDDRGPRRAPRGAAAHAPACGRAHRRERRRADADDRVRGQGDALRFVSEAVRGATYGPGRGHSGPVRFEIDGREFDPHRVDVGVDLGSVEIWELRNATALDHPFHIHIHPFQVLDVDGTPPAEVAWRDVVNVRRGSVVRIVVPFRDFAGTTMFHCHIVEHEDNGMMAHVRVVDRSASGEGARCAHR